MSEPIEITPDIDIDELLSDVYFDTVIEEHILKAYEQACIETITKARNQPSPPGNLRGMPHQPTYIDDTGNLRKSLGYAVFHNGEVWHYKADNATAKATIAKAASTMEGIAIGAVLVAGEKYATYVEKKGYNVLTQQYIEFQNVLKKYLAQAEIEIQRALNGD